MKSDQHDDSLLVDESCCMAVCVNVYSTAYQFVIMSHIIISCDVSQVEQGMINYGAWRN
jgi:hypothetical protein